MQRDLLEEIRFPLQAQRLSSVIWW